MNRESQTFEQASKTNFEQLKNETPTAKDYQNIMNTADTIRYHRELKTDPFNTITINKANDEDEAKSVLFTILEVDSLDKIENL